VDVLERLVKIALLPLEAITRFLSVGPGMILSFLALGSLAFWWRHVLLRQKRVEAALGVLEALDRLREDYHATRQQDTALAAAYQPPGAQGKREVQMVTSSLDYERRLQKLGAARDSLKAAQAKAVALWGQDARESLKPIYRMVDVLGMQAGVFWPKAIRQGKLMDAGRGDPEKMLARFPQPEMIYGQPQDETGTGFDAAIKAAELVYRPLAEGREPTR
jgi:hypothetical protein